MRKSWHSLSLEEVIRELNSRSEGLTDKEAKERLEQFGPNKLPEEKPFSKLRLFLEQFKSPLIYILLIAGIFALALGEQTDAIVIFGAVVLNTLVGYFQEEKASEALSELKKILQVKAIVFRNRSAKEILQKDLVPGDVIFLRAGDKVPADARIIENHEFSINEAALTGEWVAAKKHNRILNRETPLADRDNMIYMGTVVESGWGKGIVVGTGLDSEIGRIASMVKEAKERKTPYQKKLSHFSRVMGIIIMVISFIIFIEGIFSGHGFIQMFTTAIAVAVAAIPEGLPVAMTVILAIGMQRILKRKGLVRRLASAETLGSTSIILTDKTGTLTEAKMAVAGIYTGTKELMNNGNGFDEAIDTNGQESHILALKIATICNESFVENFEQATRRWILRGRPTEKALLLAGIQAGLSKEELERKHPFIDRVLFTPELKFAASLHKLDQAHNIFYIVGEPEKILALSSNLDNNGENSKLLLGDFKKLKEKQEKLTRQGLRVIATAYKIYDSDTRKIDLKEIDGLTFVGFFALHDPIRRGTKEVIDLCRKAGMRPIIVTGDNRLTAQAVANALGFNARDNNILEGRQLDEMNDKKLEKVIDNIQIYARVEPAQKLRIVRAWQKKHEIVAMTGDGINDAPALKQADIGVALGSGTDVAKEVSDLVLLTDNFSIIVAAIEQGRAIVDNLRKVITYLFSDTFTEIILIGVSIFLGWPLPILAAQILWVNLIEDGPMGLCLAFEPKEKDVMEQRPKNYGFSLLNKEMKVLVFIIGFITDLLLFGLFYYLFKYTSYSIAHIRSVIFAGLTIDSLFYIFCCKSLRKNIWQINPFSNKFLISAWFLGIMMLLAAFYLSPLQTLLRTVPLNFFDWQLVIGLGFLNLVAIEITKFWFIARHQV